MSEAYTASAIDHVRALVRAGQDGTPPPAEAIAWVGSGLALYLHHGTGLAQALGLIRYGGGGNHAMRERRRQRDDLLHEVRRRHFVDMGPSHAATAIATALRAQARARGRPAGELSQKLQLLLRFNPEVPASLRQLRKILAQDQRFDCPHSGSVTEQASTKTRQRQ